MKTIKPFIYIVLYILSFFLFIYSYDKDIDYIFSFSIALFFVTTGLVLSDFLRTKKQNHLNNKFSIRYYLTFISCIILSIIIYLTFRTQLTIIIVSIINTFCAIGIIVHQIKIGKEKTN